MAKTGRFKCSKCDRSFKMAAHLGRHMSTIHAAKARTKSARKKAAKRGIQRRVRRRKAARTSPRRPAMGAAASVLSQLRRYRSQLADRQAALSSQIDAIDEALAALGGRYGASQVGTTRGRQPVAGPRAGSLKDFVGRVLRARRGPMSVKDVTAGVLKAGLKTKNKTLAKSVGVALADMPGVVKVGRGQYRLR